MSLTLQKRIAELADQVLKRYKGAWLVWCDPRGDWLPLLERAANVSPGFKLVKVAEQTNGQIGGPVIRPQIQALLDCGESFVLHVPAPADQLGWLWAQALLAERIYSRPLRDQLRDWGWRPYSLSISPDEVAALARQNLGQDPAQWSSSGLQPNPALLLELLANGILPEDKDPKDYYSQFVLDLTIERAGLPPLDKAELELWRIKAVAHWLVTQIGPDLVGTRHELLITEVAQQRFALEILEQWQDRISLRERLLELILKADSVAGLRSKLGTTVTARNGPFLSQAAESVAFANTCVNLAKKNGRELLENLAELETDLAQHTESLWGQVSTHSQALPWRELRRLAQAAKTLLASAPTTEWNNPSEALTWYTTKGWRVDQAGEEFLRTLEKSTSELLNLITPLRSTWLARWEGYLMQWSQVWTASGCPTPELKSAGEWLKAMLDGDKRQPTAIIVSDAMRYDIGATLTELINYKEGAERAVVQPARTALPTITALGMGMALPLTSDELEAELVNGKWLLRHKSQPKLNLSKAEDRREWWRTQGKVAPESLLDLLDVLNGQLLPPQNNRTRLVAFDDIIDKLGHEEELEGLGSELVLERYSAAIERLRNVGWRRIFIVTDHGFIHWSGGEEKHVIPPVAAPSYSSRRAVAYPAQTKLEGPQGLAPGGKWRITFTYGPSSFRAYGGLGFFHGGASLQEWIVPCVQVVWPAKATPVEIEIKPLNQLLSLRVRVILKVIQQSLLTEDTMPRDIEVIISVTDSGQLLFRSERLSVTPNQEEIAVPLKPVEEAQAERGTELLVQVRDANTQNIIAVTRTVLMVAMDGW